MKKKVVRILRRNLKGKLSRRRMKNMMYSGTNELKNVVSLYNRIQQLKLRVVETINTLSHCEASAVSEELTDYEILMKEYYLKHGERHRQEAEVALILANEAQQANDKDTMNWSEF